MTIDKAIENLTAGRRDHVLIPHDGYTATFDLAIEALKRCKVLRKRYLLFQDEQLPGETKE